MVIPPLEGHAAHEIHDRARVLPDAAGLRGWVAHLADSDQGPVGGETPPVEAVVSAWVDDVARAAPTEWLEDLAPHVYVVDERVQWEPVPTWPPGDPTPGHTRIAFTTKLPTLARDQFADHWDTVHGRVVRDHSPGVWGYVQNVVAEVLTPDARSWDGVAELRFRDLGDLLTGMYDSEAGRHTLRADTLSFLDPDRGERVLTTQWVILSPPERRTRFAPR